VPGGKLLIAQAPGHAPDMKQLVAGPNSPSIELRLGQGRTIHGRVVDSVGQPISGVPIYASGWRGQRALNWSAKTDGNGRFQWEDAPAEPVWIRIDAKGYLGISDREIRASENELTLSLRRQLRVRGTVVDAATGRPVERFTLVPGRERGLGSPTYWDRGEVKSFGSGRFEMTFTQPADEGRRFRIDAEGYEPGVSRIIRDTDADVTLKIELKAGAGISGVVTLPNGQPAPGADVVLITTSEPASITNGQPPWGSDHRSSKTGANGRFKFPSEDPPYTILVLDDRGYAERLCNQPEPLPKLVLRPWSRVEGIVKVGTQPGANQALALFYQGHGDVAKAIPSFHGKTKSDASGHFAFERVIPGEVTIAKVVQKTETSYSYSHATVVNPSPGETARLTVGGVGRPVVGRISVPELLAAQIDWRHSNNRLVLKPPKPPEVQLVHGYPRSQRSYDVEIKPDRTFRVEDVELGTYLLYISVDGPPRSPRSPLRDRIAGGHREVVVDPMLGGRSDDPLDIGTIPLEPVQKLNQVDVADPAPSFEVQTLDDKPLKLADFRGKYVLLDFWATWCGPCLEETPRLKAVFDAYRGDDRLVMIGLSLDAKKDAPRKYVLNEHLGWIQGFLGDWSNATVPANYGVRGIPSIWLIGPDGKVVAKDLRGSAIKTAVDEALKRE
jgi:thiol-disulfide isomerase/thioredoxin